MLADALKLILDTAKRANEAQILDIESDGRVKHVRIGNEIREIGIKPRPRDHKVFSLPALIEYANGMDEATSVVWHGHNCVKLVLDDDDRRDTVTLQICHSKQYELLKRLEIEKPWSDQFSFIRMLRLDLGLDNIGVVAKFRKLAWADGSKTMGEFVHGADKLGKSINAQIENAADLPDELDVHVPVYDEFPSELYAVKCAVEIDSRNQRLQLVPLPGELDRVLVATHEFIHDWLLRELPESGVIPIYYGEA